MKAIFEPTLEVITFTCEDIIVSSLNNKAYLPKNPGYTYDPDTATTKIDNFYDNIMS